MTLGTIHRRCFFRFDLIFRNHWIPCNSCPRPLMPSLAVTAATLPRASEPALAEPPPAWETEKGSWRLDDMLIPKPVLDGFQDGFSRVNQMFWKLFGCGSWTLSKQSSTFWQALLANLELRSGLKILESSHRLAPRPKMSLPGCGPIPGVPSAPRCTGETADVWLDVKHGKLLKKW